MKIKIRKRHFADKLYLIDWPLLDASIPHNEFAARHAEESENHYLPGWFDEHGFIFPVISFIPKSDKAPNSVWAKLLPRGGIDFINDRRRIEVLAKHIDHIPMAVAVDGYINKKLLKKIAVRKMVEGEKFKLPNLPIKKRQ